MRWFSSTVNWSRLAFRKVVEHWSKKNELGTSGSQHSKIRTVLLAEKSAFCVINQDVRARLRKCSSQIPPWRIWNVEETSAVAQKDPRVSIPGDYTPMVQRTLGGAREGMPGQARHNPHTAGAPALREAGEAILSVDSEMAQTSLSWCFLKYHHLGILSSGLHHK